MSGLGLTINLDGADYTIDENRVTVRTGRVTSHYTLPRRRPRISIHEFEKGRGQLLIGGFTSVAVSVNGPLDAIRRLRDAVL
jgi:hypothetical protein